MVRLQPTASELERKSSVLGSVRAAVEEGRVIRLGDLHENDFAGSVGPYHYLLEGEEDLLHLMVMRKDGGRLSVEEGQAVAGFLFDLVPPGMIWVKPGDTSQHFYLGHDVLLEGRA